MKRQPLDHADRLRENAQAQSGSLRIWRMIRRHQENPLVADHPLVPREPGLGICAHCGLDRISHPSSKSTGS